MVVLDMNVINNKKGFTLIELLAVIVILAVIILIAASNIGAMTQTARKNVLAVEANTLIDSAKTAYQIDMLEGGIADTGKCYSLAELKNNGYFEKNDDNYHGSVQITPSSSSSSYTYKVWISNGSYRNSNQSAGNDLGINGIIIERSTSQASDDCGKTTH